MNLRAQFARDGAAPSIARTTLLAGRDQVVIPAVLVPEGASAPGYPYEHIAQAMFTPDQDDISNSARTSSQQPYPGEALTGMQRDTAMPGDNPLHGPRQFDPGFANAPQFGAAGANHAYSNSAATAATPRRSVRSAQANFSATAPQPHLDNSRDVINAAVRALSTELDSSTEVD